MKLKALMAVGMIAMLPLTNSYAEALSAEQKKEVEEIIHQYLISNPEVLIEVSQALQQKQQQSMQEKAKSAVSENAGPLFNETISVAGNPQGDVTLVEFFDYQCIHCKKMTPVIDGLIKKNANLRVVYREFPIFGKNSETASKAALAAGMQGKYKEMHNALLKEGKNIDDTVIMNTAKSLGLNVDKLKKDMDSEIVKNALDANRQLAEKMNLMGTPAFVVASTPKGQFDPNSDPAFIPGAASEDVLQNLIDKASPKK